MQWTATCRGILRAEPTTTLGSGTSEDPGLKLNELHDNHKITMLVGWLVVLRIYVVLVVFQPYLDLEAGDNQSLKFKWRGGESNPRPLAPQTKSLTMN